MPQYFRLLYNIKQGDLDEMFCAYVLEVFGSNPGLDTLYRDSRLRGFTKPLHVNVGMVPRLGYDRFLPNPFEFISVYSIQRYIVWLLTMP
jgi:hypothetical protein